MRILAYIVATLCGALVLLLLFGPREPVEGEITFAEAAVGADPALYLAEQEARFDDITAGVEKRIVWAQAEGNRTPRAIVYVHGFSATSQEIRPVPDQVAARTGSNLLYTRLTGHGRGSEAMEEGSVPDWIDDYAEAVSIGGMIGDEVVVIATSTGGTIATLGLADARIETRPIGIAMLSPNFRVNNPAAALLTLPLARYWVPSVAGAERSFEPSNEDHGRYWTTSYATTALLPMAAVTAAAAELAHEQIEVPALFIFSDEDGVVDATATREVAERWGGPVDIYNPVMTEGDDPLSHVIAGDILSPGQNVAVTDIIVDWMEGL